MSQFGIVFCLTYSYPCSHATGNKTFGIIKPLGSRRLLQKLNVQKAVIEIYFRFESWNWCRHM